MKRLDVVRHLQATIPPLTDEFTDKQSITAVALSATDMTITSGSIVPVGQYITISGMKCNNPITDFIVADGLATITMQYKHDYTLGFQTEVVIKGSTEYDGVYPIYDVPTNKKIVIEYSAAQPAVKDGNVIELRNLYNGQYVVTASTASTMTVTVPSTLIQPYVFESYVDLSYRIRGLATTEWLEDLIDGKSTDAITDRSMFVTVGDVSVQDSIHSKGQIANVSTNGTDPQFRASQDFTVFVLSPIQGQTTGMKAADDMDDLRVILYKALYGFVFESGYGGTQYRVFPTGDTSETLRRPYYIHSFSFQTVFDVIETDGFEPQTVSFGDFQVQLNELFGEDDVDSIKIIDGELP